MGFTTFGLSDHLLEGVRAAGHTTPTPIQKLAILPALQGRDLLASAQTGTGKTAAFVLPILQKLGATPGSAAKGRRPRALILTPTRELANQIADAAHTYGQFLQLSVASIYGGVGMGAQLAKLRKGVDVVVATPGRLLDHMEQRSVDLSAIEVFVLDEADRMLDMGFIRDVRRIISAVPRKRQTMLFSATFSEEVARLSNQILTDPETIEAGERRSPVESVAQKFYVTERDQKMRVLADILQKEAISSTLIFVRTKHGADKVSRKLERSGIATVAIHSNRTQSQRERALAGFRKGTFRVLVATDIAARGIDVTGISHVINYDVPQYAEDYIHRIGRTGRAGATGDAVTLVSQDEYTYLRRIEQYTGKRFAVELYMGVPAGASTDARATVRMPEPVKPTLGLSRNKSPRGRKRGRRFGRMSPSVPATANA